MGEGGEGLLRGAAGDFAVRQRLLEFSNLRLGEVGVVLEIQILQLRELLQILWQFGQLITIEIQIR